MLANMINRIIFFWGNAEVYVVFPLVSVTTGDFIEKENQNSPVGSHEPRQNWFLAKYNVTIRVKALPSDTICLLLLQVKPLFKC